MSEPALKAFFKLVSHWKVRDEDARALLGGVSNGPFYEMKRDPRRVLEADRLTRVSYLIGIFKALRILHSEPLADQWVHLPNSNPLFGGQTPLAYMIRGGLPALQTVRRLLDADQARWARRHERRHYPRCDTIVVVSHLDASYLERAVPGVRDDCFAGEMLITIDDGYRSIYETAYPVLREFGFTAVLFIYTEVIDA